MLSTKGNFLARFPSKIPFLKTLNPNSALYRYGGAIVTVLVVLLVRMLLEPILQGKAAYLTFLIAVAYSAWSFGTRPALLAVILSGAAANYYFIQPFEQFNFTTVAEILNFLIFAAISVYIIDLIDRQRRTVQQLQTIQSITADLSVASTPQEVLRVVVNRAFATLGAHIGMVAILSDDHMGVQLAASLGLDEGLRTQYQHIPFTTHTPVSDAAQQQQPIWISSLDDYQRLYPHIPRAVHARTGTQATIALPLIVHEKLIGSIGMGFPTPQPFKPQDRDYILTIAGLSAHALLRAQLSERAQELAVMQERQRFARELHDGATQAIFSANILAESIPRIWQRDPQKALSHVEQIQQLTQGAGAEMRMLLYELVPNNINKAKLADLLTQLARTLENRKMITVAVKITGDQEMAPLPENIHITFYRVAQESLNNIAKHGQATKARMRLRYTKDHLELTIVDNGGGFDISAASSGFGINSMRERAEEIGAMLRIQSRIGTGTKITLRWKVPVLIP